MNQANATIPQQDWSQAVHCENGGYMRLEDYCNSGGRGISLRGNHLHITSGVILFEEEVILLVECGDRVANYVLEKACGGWDALMDLHYAEYVKKSQKQPKIGISDLYPWQKEHF